jgi:DegV family protein with EDD domain
MQIVTDQGMDLSQTQIAGTRLDTVPLKISLEGRTYQGADSIDYVAFYKLLSETESFPTTTQPSPGDFAEVYRRLAKTDPDILSIHISSGLSGTINSARLGAEMVPEANVTIVDTKTLSITFGWQVQAAARALQAGWPLRDIIKLMSDIQQGTDTLFTLADLKYLIHGGRISHIKALMGSLLNIKPVIGVSQVDGKYYSRAQEFTFKKAVQKIAELAVTKHGEGASLRVQIVHGNNPEGVELLQEKLAAYLNCTFEDTLPVAPVLGAHTGPSVIGAGFAPLDLFLHPDLNLLNREMAMA